MDLKKAVHCDRDSLLLLLHLSEAVEFRRGTLHCAARCHTEKCLQTFCNINSCIKVRLKEITENCLAFKIINQIFEYWAYI